MRYLRTRGKHSRVSNSSQPKVSFSGFSYENPTPRRVQRGSLTSIRTFVRNGNRSQPPQPITVKTELSTYRTLASVDETYHEQLKRNYLENHHATYSIGSRARMASEESSSPWAHPSSSARVSSQAYSHEQWYPVSHMCYQPHEFSPHDHYTVGRAV